MKTLAKRAHIFLFISLFFTGRALAQNALDFVENKGQWNSVIKFKGDLSNGAFFLRQTGFTVLQYNNADLVKLSESMHGIPVDEAVKTGGGNLKTSASSGASLYGKPVSEAADTVHGHAYTVDFVGANPLAQIVADKPQPTYNNYFIGDDPAAWKGDCKIYNAVTFKDVYPNIDIKYYSESGYLKYEFVVRPGGDPSQIVMQIVGADKLSLKSNELIIKTSVNEVKELSPYTFQYTGTERKQIDCRYVLTGNTVRFNIKKFSAQSTLVIDPTLIFASFSGSVSDNWGYTATYGRDGTFYAGGIVFQTGFPVSPGAFQTTYRPSQANESSFWNMGIIKFSSNGSQRMYATYLGGSNKDQPHSLFVDTDGNLVVAGRTTSTNYPLFPTTASFGTPGGWDIVVTKFNATGTALIGSIKVGGSGDDGFNTTDSHTASTPTGLVNNYGDDARSEVILDNSNNIYLASCTQSSNFFTTGNAQQKTFGGKQDAVLLKINPSCNTVQYSSYLGGSDFDAGFVLALNPSTQDIYMAGGTFSSDFPGNKSGVYQPVFGGGSSDGFVAEFSNDGSVLRRSTFVGTSGLDIIFGIQFDKFSYPYIMGTTTGNWPIKNAAYSVPNSKQFITKMEKDLSGLVYSTVFGTNSGTPNISPVAFLVDRCENVYVSGWGKDIIGKYNLSSVSGMPVTRDALKAVPDESDFYFIVIKRNASQLLYGTFYGQNGRFGEHVDGGTSRFDQNGIIYQAICANCRASDSPKPQWPTTPGAWCCSSGRAAATSGSQCNLAALKISFNFAGVASGVRAFINAVFDTTGCVPLRIQFRDTVLNAQHYEWDFGDGSAGVKTDSFEIDHTYNLVGNYRVRLIAIDSTTCNIRDTSFTTIIVRDNRAQLDFNPVKLPPCQSLTYRFDNLSVAPAAVPFHDQSFIWDFGDKTPRIIAGLASVQHTYLAVGTYTVKMIVLDTNYCNTPDSVVKELRISPQVKAQFTSPPFGCAPYTATFTNSSLGGQTFTWDFGDGTGSSLSSPKHLYTTVGTYVVKLKAYDSSTCNLQDSTQLTITVQTNPTALFTASPSVPVQNTPVTFTNTSRNASRYKWEFGDGDSLLTTSTADITHQYNTSGKFNACLIAFNAAGCSDTLCQSVTTIVVPQLDIPNAFTPLGPVQANTIYVRGFAIAKMRFAVYNRLGQKVFESNNQSQGWDGRFKGVVQPMDVYAYTLDVEFSDGTRTTRKGDITLIR